MPTDTINEQHAKRRAECQGAKEYSTTLRTFLDTFGDQSLAHTHQYRGHYIHSNEASCHAILLMRSGRGVDSLFRWRVQSEKDYAYSE